jgi:hypothetical protein
MDDWRQPAGRWALSFNILIPLSISLTVAIV